jgi:glutathione S-transferase
VIFTNKTAMPLTLVIGNKNYSSWSFRPWIAMRVAAIPFTEKMIPLYEPGSRERIIEISPAGKVPVLLDGHQAIWETIAILEYLAEDFPKADIWPSEARLRSHARSIAAEMHAGFQALRKVCPMNMWLPPKQRPVPQEVMENVHRINSIWHDCLARYGGPFLFGPFGAADAMYAPVVSRFHTYGILVSPKCHAYMDRVMALPAWREWHGAALQEQWIMRHNEPDWPLVKGVRLE